MGELYSISAGEQAADQQIGGCVREHENETIKLQNSDGESSQSNPLGNDTSEWSEKNRQALAEGKKLYGEICEALDHSVVVMPFHPKSKRPVSHKWQNVTLEVMSHPLWLLMLGRPGRNLGVLMGEVSQNLCSFDFDDQRYADEFLAANPAFAATYTTTGARGCNYWVVIEGGYPASFDLKNSESKNICEFRANKRLTIIRGVHPSGVAYRVLNAEKPITIRWDDIKWPPQWPKREKTIVVAAENKAPVPDWCRQIEETHGSPVLVSDLGNVEINQVAFSEVFLVEYPLMRDLAGGFHRYDADSGVWLATDVPVAKRELGNYMAAFARKNRLPALLFKRTDYFLKEMIGHLKGRAPMIPDKSAGGGGILHFANGMLDLDAPGKLLPFNPGFYSRNQTPHRFENEAECPMFMKFLSDALPADDAVLLQKWAGMALLGKNFAQAILLLLGRGGSGKSTFLKIIIAIVGELNQTELRTDSLSRSRFEESRYVNKTMLVGTDVRGDFLNRVGAQRLKSLTGGDTMDAEFKGLNGNVPFRGEFVIAITSNQRLRLTLDGDHDAWARRLKIVRFDRCPEKKDPQFAEKIVSAEAAGIINWMIAGLALLRQDFKEQGCWVLSETQQNRIDDLMAESDSIRSFVHNALCQKNTSTVTTEELFRAYDYFCEQRGWDAHAKNVFAREMPNAVEDAFGLRLRHDILRCGLAKRGYKGLEFSIEIPGSLAGDSYVADF